jgi:hypothetical protein
MRWRTQSMLPCSGIASSHPARRASISSRVGTVPRISTVTADMGMCCTSTSPTASDTNGSTGSNIA